MTALSVGKYRLLDRIGAGAMGEVYRAHDSILDRPVALKIISGGDDERRQRFQREAQSAARLTHPNIVTVHDFGEDSGRFYMAMELLEGSDLKAAIARNLLPDLRSRLRAKAHRSTGTPSMRPSGAPASPPAGTAASRRGCARDAYASQPTRGAGEDACAPAGETPALLGQRLAMSADSRTETQHSREPVERRRPRRLAPRRPAAGVLASCACIATDTRRRRGRLRASRRDASAPRAA